MEVIKSTFCILILVKYVQMTESKGPSEGLIGIRLFTEGPSTHIDEPLESAVRIFTNEHYKSSLPLMILIHGMDASVDCGFVEGSVKALYSKGLNKEFNIIALDFPELMAKQSLLHKYLYSTAINSKIAGEAIGDFLNEVIQQQYTSPDKIHVVGYSVGAHVAGYLARQIKQEHGQIFFIVGLDPAGLGFTPYTIAAWYTGLIHLTVADAKYVHFLHCNSIGWGTLYHNATANFIFNGGYFQPGCDKSKYIGCSHNRVPFYFINSILYSEQFIAQRCDSWKDFSSCHCSFEETRHVTFPPDLRAKGNYYLRTSSETPFGQGETGIECLEEDGSYLKEKDNAKKQNTQIRIKYVNKLP